jgi:hypothetical protein
VLIVAGKDAPFLLFIFNQCIALLDPGISGKNIIIQTGESIEVASDIGLKACKERTGSSSCKVTYSCCTDPVYRK